MALFPTSAGHNRNPSRQHFSPWRYAPIPRARQNCRRDGFLSWPALVGKRAMQTGHRFFSDLSSGAGRSNFNPPTSPGIRRKAKASWSSRTKPGRTTAGRAAKKRHEMFGSIPSSARAQEIVKRQGPRSGFGAPTQKERRRNRRRSRVTGWSSLRLTPHRRA